VAFLAPSSITAPAAEYSSGEGEQSALLVPPVDLAGRTTVFSVLV
jgi:hypothetical protein